MTGSISADVARQIRLVSLDVDGVLTDGSFITGTATANPATESTRFSVLDGLGIHLMREAGLEVALVSGRKSGAVKVRARELRLTEVHLGVKAKVPVVEEMLKRNGWTWSQVAHLGDDLADLAVLEKVALPAAVANAVPEVKQAALWVGGVEGGHGAVREFARALLVARGEWETQVERYVAKGRGP